MLIASDVTRSYATAGGPLEILRGINLRLSAGDSLAIMGPSGCGKSTLLNILGALDPPTSGTVRLDNVDPYALERREAARFRNERIGFIFQDHLLLNHLTVLENVLLPSLARFGEYDQVPRATELLKRVGLSGRMDHRPAELSGGERQRTAIARAFLNRPRLILADEPTGNLDRASAAQVMDLLLEVAASNEAILIVVTHAESVAARLGRVVELVDGRLTPVVDPGKTDGGRQKADMRAGDTAAF